MRRTTVAVVTTALLALPACSEDPEVREPAPSASPSPSATPTSPAPTLPPQAEENSTEGAVASVVHWVALLNHASLTGDTDPLAEASSPSCDGCSAYIDLFSETYAKGGYFRGSEWEPSQARVEKSGSQAIVYLHIDAPEGTYRESAVSDELRGNSEDTDLVFVVKRDSDTWLVDQMGLESEMT